MPNGKVIGTQPSGSRWSSFEDNIGQLQHERDTILSAETENEVDAKVVFAQQRRDQAGLHIPAQPDLQSENRRTENTGSQYQFQPTPSSEIFGPARDQSNRGLFEDNVGQYNMSVTQSSQEAENEVYAQTELAGTPAQAQAQAQVPVGLHTPTPARAPSNNPFDKHTTEKNSRCESGKTLQSSKPKRGVCFWIFQLIMAPIFIPVFIVLSVVVAYSVVKLCLQKKPFFESPLSMGEKVLFLSISLPLSVLLTPIMIILSPYFAYIYIRDHFEKCREIIAASKS